MAAAVSASTETDRKVIKAEAAKADDKFGEPIPDLQHIRSGAGLLLFPFGHGNQSQDKTPDADKHIPADYFH